MAYHLYLKKQLAEEILAMCDAFLEVGAGKHTDNIYYAECMSTLKTLRDELSKSIAYHRQKGLAADSNSADERFNKGFTDWRSLIELHAGIPALSTSAGCAEAAEILRRIDRDLYQKSKAVQIALFDTYIAESEAGGGALHASTGFEEQYEELKETHFELKRIENSRAELPADAAEAPYKAAARAEKIITLIHEHLEGYSHLGGSAYEETLQAVRAQVAPIITAVKARITKGKNDSSQDQASTGSAHGQEM